MQSYILLGLLFFLLSPNVIFNLSPETIGKKMFMKNETSLTSVIIHTLLFVIILYLLNNYGLLEGFKGKNRTLPGKHNKSSDDIKHH